MMHEIIHYLGISLGAAFLLVIVSKYILQNIIRRDCSYYEKKEIAEENEMLAKAGISQREGEK